ncbi:MAG: hypothetical protein JWP78_3356 [Mucilaginibacter sp.]|nr:hypothetical protein [Mucilaginibacter sp.]
MRPQFVIIAGPNGASKSVFGHFHVPENTPVFNGDLVFAELMIQYPQIEVERLAGV